MLYDGSPFYPSGEVLWRYCEDAGMTLFGTSAKYIDALKNSELEPGKNYDLSELRTLCSTGSVLAPESFDYVYHNIKQDLCLSSVSGGTDIVSCFALGCPILPVYRGEIQCRGLGMAVDVFDEEAPAGRAESLLERGYASRGIGSRASRFISGAIRPARSTTTLILPSSTTPGTTVTMSYSPNRAAW